MMAGAQTKTNEVYEDGGHEETRDALMPGQDLDLGIKPKEETLPECQDTVEPEQGKDEIHEGEEEDGRTKSVYSQKDLEITSEEHEEPNEVEHMLEEDQGDGEQKNEATEREPGLTEGSPESPKSQTHGETSMMHALGEESLPSTDENEQEKRDEVLDP